MRAIFRPMMPVKRLNLTGSDGLYVVLRGFIPSGPMSPVRPRGRYRYESRWDGNRQDSPQHNAAPSLASSRLG